MNLSLAKRLDRMLGGATAAALRLARKRRPLEPDFRVRRILVVKLWGMGNWVLLAPLVGALARRWPLAEIDALSFDSNRQILDADPRLARRHLLPLRGFGKFALAAMRTAVALRRRRYDVVVDFEQFSRFSEVIVRLAAPRHAIGFRAAEGSRGLLYDAAVPYREERHMSEIFGDLVRAAGVTDFRYATERPAVPEAAREAIARRLPEGDGPLLVFHPGSGDNFPGRRWPLEHVAQLADRLVRAADARVVFTGSHGERDLVELVRSRMEERSTSLAGETSYFDLAALLERSALVFSNDTGPLHLASALAVPVFAFFGPNTPLLYGPLSAGSVAFYAALPCSPCITNANAKTSTCRLPLCMKAIRPDDVAERALELLRSRRAAIGRG
ncbi:MAG: glycosyltransferase family 9 protein [Planctomycetes bacterium]|nr:glycosyltransferase family 9 protein [Planctomycetota bacterium]